MYIMICHFSQFAFHDFRIKMDLSIKIFLDQQQVSQLSFQLEEGKKVDLKISVVPHQEEEHNSIKEEADLGVAVGLADDMVLTTPEEQKDDDTAMEALLIEAANNARTNFYSDISNDSLIIPENDEDQIVKEEHDIHEEDKANEEVNLVQEIDHFTEHRLNRQELLAKSRRLGIYPNTVENGIFDNLNDIMVKFSEKNIYINIEVINIASIICTLFYLIRKSSDFPIQSIAIASIAIASKISSNRLNYKWKSILSEDQLKKLSSDEETIQHVLKRHLSEVEDPVNIVEKLCIKDIFSSSLKERARIIAQQKLKDQSLVQTSLPIDIARLSVNEAILMSHIDNQIPGKSNQQKLPYSCNICGKVFGRQKKRLFNHAKTCEETISNRKYKSDCGKAYKQKQSLLRHLASTVHRNGLCKKMYSECN